MSPKDFKTQCASLTGKCQKDTPCKAHISLENLERISSKLSEILSQSREVTTDWTKNKKVHSASYGYLNLAINQPKIWKEVELIKILVERFNNSRERLWKYKQEISNKIFLKPNPLRQTAPRRPTTSRFFKQKWCKPQEISSTRTRMFRNYTYNNKEFKLISLRAFYSSSIRETMTIWEENSSDQF